MSFRRCPSAKGGARGFRHGAAPARPARFAEMFVQPLADVCRSLHRGEGSGLAPEARERMRERASGQLPPASIGEARLLHRVALSLLAKAGGCRDEESFMRLRAAVSRLGRLLAACSMRRHAVGTADRQERVPPRMMAQVQSAVREVVVYASNVSLTINAARGSHVAVYISPGPDSEDKDERKEEKKAEAPSPPETGEEPKKKRTRGKGKIGIRRRTGIANCPYIFKLDRRTIVFKPTGAAYAITAPAAVRALNRLTLAMKNTTDWFAKFTGKDAEAMRSACPEFLDDCVEREGVATGDGNHRLTGRACLVRVRKDRK